MVTFAIVLQYHRVLNRLLQVYKTLGNHEKKSISSYNK